MNTRLFCFLKNLSVFRVLLVFVDCTRLIRLFHLQVELDRGNNLCKRSVNLDLLIILGDEQDEEMEDEQSKLAEVLHHSTESLMKQLQFNRNTCAAFENFFP